MTLLALWLWIALGIALQLIFFTGLAFWRHWQAYLLLKNQPSAGVAKRPAGQIESGASAQSASADYRPFRVARKVIEDGAGSIFSFYLEALDAKPLPPFLPGQFLTFRLDVPMTAGKTEQIIRCYSLSDAPCPDVYRVSIKRVPAPPNQHVPPGRTSNYFHDHVEAGSVLQVRAPAGHFYIESTDAPVVLIAGGIGVTPLLSMLNWCMTTQPEREVWLFYGVRNSQELIMKAHLAALAAAHPNFHLYLCFSAPLSDDHLGRDYQHRGRADVRLLRQQLSLLPYQFYVCGPNAMMQSIVSDLEDWGVPHARIHFEAFGPASIKLKRAPDQGFALEESDVADTSIVVTFSKSGKAIPWRADAENLLEFAEANGVSIDFGCRAGACGSCQTAILSGEVRYRQAPDYDPAPGTCLLCVSQPKTNVSLEA